MPILHRKAILPIQMELGEDKKHGSSEDEDDEEKNDDSNVRTTSKR